VGQVARKILEDAPKLLLAELAERAHPFAGTAHQRGHLGRGELLEEPQFKGDVLLGVRCNRMALWRWWELPLQRRVLPTAARPGGASRVVFSQASRGRCVCEGS